MDQSGFHYRHKFVALDTLLHLHATRQFMRGASLVQRWFTVLDKAIEIYNTLPQATWEPMRP